jgi:hypothetical protein
MILNTTTLNVDDINTTTLNMDDIKHHYAERCFLMYSIVKYVLSLYSKITTVLHLTPPGDIN